MIQLKIEKLTENHGATKFRLTPSSFTIGAQGANMVDEIGLDIPPEWQDKAVRLCFIPSDGKPFTVLWQNENIKVSANMATPMGAVVVDAIGDNNYHAYTTNRNYRTYAHFTPDESDQPVYTPSQIERFLSRAQTFANIAQSAKNEAKTTVDGALSGIVGAKETALFLIETAKNNALEQISTRQIVNDVEKLKEDVINKVDKIAGKGLSENDYTDRDKDLVLRTERSVDYLWKRVKGIVYDVETVTSQADVVTVPTGAMKYASLDVLGGMSIKADGQIINARVSEIKTSTKNIFDPEIDIDGAVLASDGQINPSSAYVITKKVPVLPSTQYFISCDRWMSDPIRVGLYDANNNFISRPTYEYDKKFTVPANTRYLCVCYYNADEGYKNAKIQIEKGTKTEYTEHWISKIIPPEIQQLEGYGIGINDSGNNFEFNTPQTYFDELTQTEKTGNNWYVENISEVDLGSLNWTAATSYSGLSGHYRMNSNSLTDMTGESVADKYLTDKFDVIGIRDAYDGRFGIIYDAAHDTTLRIETDISSRAAFKTAMQGAKLYYKRETPKYYCIDHLLPADFEILQVEAGGTVKFCYPNNDAHSIAVPSTVEYMVNVQGVV